MPDEIELLRSRWRGQGLPLSDGLAVRAIEEFQEVHDLTLAADVRDYFRRLNGSSFEDADGCRLYPLEEFKQVGTFFKKINSRWPSEPRQAVAHYWICGDYCNLIALWAVKPGPTSEVVVIDGPFDVRLVAHNFADFLLAYAREGPDSLI